ncbi:MAG: hypothetical protein IJ485_05825 [Lachnospiraceae bacterium]|nr:hypothetical protein [Lachnospiraceae bacterium]
MHNEHKRDYAKIHYVKTVTVGSVNPNKPLSEEARKLQIERLNRCLEESPKGTIIGKDISIGRYMIGEHELTMQQTTYHIGFVRKPLWIEESGDA